MLGQSFSSKFVDKTVCISFLLDNSQRPPSVRMLVLYATPVMKTMELKGNESQPGPE